MLRFCTRIQVGLFFLKLLSLFISFDREEPVKNASGL